MKSILVVDDDPMMRLLLQQALSGAEAFNFFEAVDGTQAIELFSANDFDLVLLDVDLPKIDGFAVLQSIRASDKGEFVPVVMITGVDDNASIEQAYQMGATDFVAKPLNWSQIRYHLRYVLRSSSDFESLRKTELRLDHAQEIARLGYWELNWERDKLILSRQLSRMLAIAGNNFEHGMEKLVGLIHPDDRIGFKLVLRQSFEDNASFNLEARVEHPDGTLYMQIHGECRKHWSYDGTILAGTMQDISELRKSQKMLTYMAHHDALTDLPNRTLFQQMLERGIQRAERMKRKVALLFIDLDRFKNINDSLGHDIGDELLKQVSLRLQGVIRNYDVVARFGGDEFVVMLDAIKDEHDALGLTSRVLTIFDTPFELGEHTHYVSGSIGISLYPDNGTSTDELIRNADTAMYQAKQSEQHQLAFYSHSQTDQTMKRWRLENELRQALADDEFRLLYQPKVTPDSDDIVGVEALIRWQRKDGSLVSPGDFIPVAEETGLIVPMGNWVIKESINQLKRWKNSECGHLTIAVNVSGRQLYSSEFCEFIATELRDADIAADKLELEITEDYLVNSNDEDHCQQTLQELNDLGIKMAVDDFGTGYSSLSQLKSLPISILKIDKSFIDNIAESEKDSAVVKSIISLAKNLRLEVVAEGVETSPQLENVSKFGCQMVQGYFYSRPVPAEEIQQQVIRKLL